MIFWVKTSGSKDWQELPSRAGLLTAGTYSIAVQTPQPHFSIGVRMQQFGMADGGRKKEIWNQRLSIKTNDEGVGLVAGDIDLTPGLWEVRFADADLIAELFGEGQQNLLMFQVIPTLATGARPGATALDLPEFVRPAETPTTTSGSPPIRGASPTPVAAGTPEGVEFSLMRTQWLGVPGEVLALTGRTNCSGDIRVTACARGQTMLQKQQSIAVRPGSRATAFSVQLDLPQDWSGHLVGIAQFFPDSGSGSPSVDFTVVPHTHLESVNELALAVTPNSSVLELGDIGEGEHAVNPTEADEQNPDWLGSEVSPNTSTLRTDTLADHPPDMAELVQTCEDVQADESDYLLDGVSQVDELFGSSPDSASDGDRQQSSPDEPPSAPYHEPSSEESSIANHNPALADSAVSTSSRVTYPSPAHVTPSPLPSSTPVIAQNAPTDRCEDEEPSAGIGPSLRERAFADLRLGRHARHTPSQPESMVGWLAPAPSALHLAGTRASATEHSPMMSKLLQLSNVSPQNSIRADYDSSQAASPVEATALAPPYQPRESRYESPTAQRSISASLAPAPHSAVDNTDVAAVEAHTTENHPSAIPYVPTSNPHITPGVSGTAPTEPDSPLADRGDSILTLDIPATLQAGESTIVTVHWLDRDIPPCAKLWVINPDIDVVVDGPRWLLDFTLHDDGLYLATTQLTVPFGVSRLRFEAIAQSPSQATTTESDRAVSSRAIATVDRQIS